MKNSVALFMAEVEKRSNVLTAILKSCEIREQYGAIRIFPKNSFAEQKIFEIKNINMIAEAADAIDMPAYQFTVNELPLPEEV